MYREKGVLSHLDDGNNRVLQNVGALIPYYTVSHPEECLLHSCGFEISNLTELLSRSARWASFFVFMVTSFFIISLVVVPLY